MVSVAIVLREKTNGHSINLRLTHNRKSVFVALGHLIDPALFKPNALSNWVHGRHPDAVFINADIEKKRRTAMDAIQQTDDLKRIAAAVKGKSYHPSGDGSFLKAMEDRTLYYYERNATGLYYKLRYMKTQVELAWSADISPDQITKKDVEKYILHRKKEGINDNTIKKELSYLGIVFKSVCKMANPFNEVKIDPVPTKKEKLTKQEIGRIEDATLTGFADLARDMFLFSFYAQGMRFQNVALMPATCIKNGRLVYQMNKGRKHREIEAHPKLLAIVEKYQGAAHYLFPMATTPPKDAWEMRSVIGTADALINRYLKLVANVAGVTKNISFHIARHTFSNLALQHGADYRVLKDALGHSNFQTTQKYLDSLSDDNINKALRGMYD